jgi:hypothetical protein
MDLNSKTIFFIIAGLLIILVFVVAPTAAVKVEGAKILLDVKPGITYIFPMAVSTKLTDAPSDYAVEVYGFGQSADGGSYAPLLPAEDTGAFSARTFVSLPSSTIHIDPGERKEFNATIRVPQNVGGGGRYAIIHIHPAAGSGQTTFATAIIVPVMLTVQDTALVQFGSVTDIKVGEIAQGKPVTVLTTLKNTGNHHYYGATNQVSVRDGKGALVAMANASPIPNAVIPGQSVIFEAPISSPLTAGTYTITSTMRLESGTVLDSKSTDILIKETYVPPFHETDATVSPDSAATISVPEGTVLISIPRGAVLAETRMMVKPYAESLPPVPAGSVAGSTAFSVDGLSGLLAQDATVTVRYNQADLDAAGGNPGKLVLGRFDRIEGHWTILQTVVDQNARTLTATTNRFSIWAVIAAQRSTQAKMTEIIPVTSQESQTRNSPGPDSLAVLGVIAFLLLYRNYQKNL